ncbi:MAG: dihydropteroate synthase [Pirellulaceae bacterium]
MTNSTRSFAWQLSRTRLEFAAVPALMAIVNVTPDSFSDGGNWLDAGRAIEHGLKLVDQGAAILDIGGESTRPYSQSVSPDEQIRRVIPVIKGLASQTAVPLSIDTSSAEVARAAIDAGAQIINDVTGLTGDQHMMSVARDSRCGVCAMHMQGTPQTMQDNPQYKNCVTEIHDYLQRRRDDLLSAGIDRQRICLDPGIGFGKTHEHNWELIRQADRFLDLGVPVLIGHSRKGFIGKMSGERSTDRDAGTLGISLFLAARGIQLLRVHEVQNTIAALTTFMACTKP